MSALSNSRASGNTVRTAGIVALMLVVTATNASAGGPFFMGLGKLSNGVDGEATDISADGSTVVGWSNFPDNTEAFRWTQASGMVGLGALPGGMFSEAHAVSVDGSKVVGFASTPTGAAAFEWTAGTGMTMIGAAPTGPSDRTVAGAVSGDGMNIAGTLGSVQAIRWLSDQSVSSLGDLPGGGTSSGVGAMSGDGSVIVGHGSSSLGTREAFRWTEATGMVGLGDFPGGVERSEAHGVSSDGTTIVGNGFTASGAEAFRWTVGEGMVSLGDLAGGDVASSALDASADGSVIVGWSQTAANAISTAVIWDAVNGMRDLQDVLTNDLNLDLSGWTLWEAEAISDDGLTIAGTGVNPDGFSEPWIARIPEPHSLLLVWGGVCSLMVRRRLCIGFNRDCD